MKICYNFFMKGFGERIKELRKEKNWTQKELAERIQQAQSAVFYWENDKQEPTISALKKLCLAFNTTADYLIGLENETGSKIDIDLKATIYKGEKQK